MNALNIFKLDKTTKEDLAQGYADMVDMIQKKTLSTSLKNTNLSGDPTTGSVRANRLTTSLVKPYGTARTAGKGDQLNNNGVLIEIDDDREIFEDLEMKDIKLSGIKDVFKRRTGNQRLSMSRYLDEKFFDVAKTSVVNANKLTKSRADNIAEVIEELIVKAESTKNDNVDGVDRELLVLTLDAETHSRLRNKIDTLPNPADGGVKTQTFHEVEVHVNLRQTVPAICMAKGSVAQPVWVEPYQPEKAQYSNAIICGLVFHLGTKAVMPDLIYSLKWSD